MALKQGNVATFGATSRRSGQRRDVPDRTFSNVATLRSTSRRSREESVPTSRRSIQRRDVPENVKNQHRDVGYQCCDVPEEFKINIATFQRRSKSTSQHWISTSRRSRGVQNQRRDVGISRRDVPEEGKIDVATLRANVATLRANVATLQRRLKMQIKEPWSRIRENSPLINVHLWTFVVST